MEIVYKQEAYDIVGACFEVYNEMGCGFLEAVYQECLQIEFETRGIPFRPQAELVLRYKGRSLNQKYQPDFVCFDKIVVELKAASELMDYLKATAYRLGLLVNFGHFPKLDYERIVK